jgi:hypothetical protein
MRNPLPNWLRALFAFYFYIHALKMAHVQIRGGVADWYWTADFRASAVIYNPPSNLLLLIALWGATFWRSIHRTGLKSRRHEV